MLRNVFKMCDPVQWLRSQRKLSRRLRAAKKGVVGIMPAKELEHALDLEALAERFGDADHTVGGIHDEVAEFIELAEGNEPDDSDTLVLVMGMRKAVVAGNMYGGNYSRFMRVRAHKRRGHDLHVERRHALSSASPKGLAEAIA